MWLLCCQRFSHRLIESELAVSYSKSQNTKGPKNEKEAEILRRLSTSWDEAINSSPSSENSKKRHGRLSAKNKKASFFERIFESDCSIQKFQDALDDLESDPDGFECLLHLTHNRAEALKTDPSEFWTHKALLIEKLKNLDPQETEFTHQYNDTWLNICSLITDFLLLGCLKTVERAVSDSAQTDWARISLSEFKRFIESSFHEWSKNSLPQFIDSGDLRQCLEKVSRILSSLTYDESSQSERRSVSLNKLLQMLSIILYRSVSIESIEEVKRKWLEVSAIFDAVGFGQTENISKIISSDGKGVILRFLMLMIYKGETKLDLTLNRSCAYQGYEELLLPMLSQQWGNVIQDYTENASELFKFSPRFKTDYPFERIESGEGHGLRKEMFHYISSSLSERQLEHSEDGTSLSDRSFQRARTRDYLLEYSRDKGCLWFNLALNETTENKMRYRLLGWTMAQAICNNCLLPLPLPLIFFKKFLMGLLFRPDFKTLKKLDYFQARTIEKYLRDFMATHNCKTISFQEATEVYVTLGLPTSAIQDVDKISSRQLLDKISETVINSWQFQELSIGFRNVMGFRSAKNGLWKIDYQTSEGESGDPISAKMALSAEELQMLVCGDSLSAVAGDWWINNPQLDLREFFRIIVSKDLIDSPTVDALWLVIKKHFKGTRLRRLLVFITGSDRLPKQDSEILQVNTPFVLLPKEVEAQRNIILRMLPQAHTCDNSLELPDYAKFLGNDSKIELEKILHSRLDRAIDEGLAAGYSLDELEEEEERNQNAFRESYEDITDDEDVDVYCYSP